MLDTPALSIEPLIESLVATRRYLHRNPEVSGTEFETTKYLAGLLDEHKIAWRVGPDNRGLLVDLGDPDATRRIAIRGDIDAIPVNDSKTVEYRSHKPHAMHACGHDAHSSMLLGTVVLLQQWFEQNGCAGIGVRAIFQPEEEVARGAQAMIEHGALENVTAILSSHVDPTRPVGSVGLRSGVNTAHCDVLKVTIHGKGGHAARPHETIDPIAAGVQFINAIYGQVNRISNSQTPVVLTFGQFLGGDCSNVIPDSVELKGTLRSLDSNARQTVMEAVGRVANGISVATSAQFAVEFGKTVPAMLTDPELTAMARDTCLELLGENHVSHIERPSMGGEDFAFYTDRVPAAFLRLGSAGMETGHLPLHNSGFDIDEGVLPIGATLMANCAVRYLRTVAE